jgi:hypothetical protein
MGGRIFKSQIIENERGDFFIVDEKTTSATE